MTTLAPPDRSPRAAIRRHLAECHRPGDAVNVRGLARELGMNYHVLRDCVDVLRAAGPSSFPYRVSPRGVEVKRKFDDADRALLREIAECFGARPSGVEIARRFEAETGRRIDESTARRILYGRRRGGAHVGGLMEDGP